MMLLAAALLLAAPLPPVPSAPASDIAIAQDNSLAPSSVEPPILILSLSPEIGTRRVTYRDRVTTGLASYQSGAIGLLRLAAEVYPSRGKGLPVVSDIGFFGSTSRSLRSSSQFAPGSTFEDRWHAWDVGARWRGMFSGEERLALSIRYGSLSSDLSGPRLYNVLLPTGTLQYWRPGLDLRFPWGPLSLSISGGYLGVVVQDAIGHAFPRATQGGIDGGAAIAWNFRPQMELRLSGRYMRFFYSLRPQPQDPFVAGGALDEYVVFDLGFSLRV